MAMNALAAERFRRFKRNKLGVISAWIFGVLFFLSLFAEFLANDKPLLLTHNGRLYAPVFVDYPETEFGGEFETTADYRDPFVKNLIEESGRMIWPPIRFSFNTINYNLPSPAPSPPTRENWLGTDDRGRDVMARVIYGFRISVLFGFTLTVVSAAVGVSVGAFMGYFGGKLDIMGQRVIEVWGSLPTLFILIILSSIVTPNFWWLLGILLLFQWMGFVGVVRAEFLRARNLEFVLSAKAMGLSDRLIIYRHVLPNAMVATLTFMPFSLSGSVTILTSLSFLGFGLPPGSPSLGELLAQAKANLQAPWLGISAFVVLALILTLLVFAGEAVRDAFDPRKAV
ncbi:MAG: ABC transporter permease [Spirochaetaceae bacterium]|nr:ABC transporter permease [Spirochaetaceae bacterium]MDT8296715.1 ABC transporter permease [Spirochaetaceae bacterium]